MKKNIILLAAMLFSAGCATQSVLPEKEDVKVTRKAADKDCSSIGKITGTAPGLKGTREQALEDLKQEAANKGANFIQVQQYSAQGTSVTGLAFKCP